MSTHGDGGKGSGRRKEDVKKIHDNWDLIFGTKKEQPMNDEDYTEHEDYDDSEARDCPVCRGQMTITGTGMYLFCDTCGHREELDEDDSDY